MKQTGKLILQKKNAALVVLGPYAVNCTPAHKAMGHNSQHRDLMSLLLKVWAAFTNTTRHCSSFTVTEAVQSNQKIQRYFKIQNRAKWEMFRKYLLSQDTKLSMEILCWVSEPFYSLIAQKSLLISITYRYVSINCI